MAYRFLFFDADNTLFDFSKGEENAFFAATAEMGITATDSDYACYSAGNDSLWKQFERNEIPKSAIFANRFAIFKEKTGYDVDPIALNRCYVQHLSRQTVLMPYALELLSYLRDRGYRLFLLTNGTAFIQESRLEKSPLKPYFEKVFISEAVGYAKPSPLFFEAVAHTIPAFRKEEALMIGDSESSDILGANTFGIDACYFNYRNKPLKSAYAKYSVHTLQELTTIL